MIIIKVKKFIMHNSLWLKILLVVKEEKGKRNYKFKFLLTKKLMMIIFLIDKY